MNLKYKEVPQAKLGGYTILIGSIICILVMQFFIYWSWDVVSHAIILFETPFALVTILLLLIITKAIFLIKHTTIDYLIIDNKILSIHILQGFFRPRKIINIEEIEKGYILNGKLILILNTEKEIEILIENLFIKDFEKLTIELSKYISINKNFG